MSIGFYIETGWASFFRPWQHHWCRCLEYELQDP